MPSSDDSLEFNVPANGLSEPQSGNRRFVRDLFTNELKEVFDHPIEVFQEINQRFRDKAGYNPAADGRHGNPWYKPNLELSMSIPAEQATPERIARENAEAKRHGTGATYAPDGNCFSAGRQSRAREMRRTGKQDNNPGFGDYAGS